MNGIDFGLLTGFSLVSVLADFGLRDDLDGFRIHGILLVLGRCHKILLDLWSS